MSASTSTILTISAMLCSRDWDYAAAWTGKTMKPVSVASVSEQEYATTNLVAAVFLVRMTSM
jgi:hypothetical protein